ncbi:MAG: zf-HC2 domain-containing protein [Vicinamibacterales bacterium]
MSTHHDDATARAAAALDRALDAADELDHPGYEALEAWVDDRLEAVEREIVESHVQACAACAEDAADLRQVRADIRWGGQGPAQGDVRWGPASPKAPARWRMVAAIAGIAAALVLAVVLMRDGRNAMPDTAAVTAPAPPPAPAGPGAADTSEPPLPVLPLSPEDRAFVASVLERRTLEVPDEVRALGGARGTLLGAGDLAAPAEPMTPAGTAVQSTTPIFSWRAVPGATAYTVTIVNEDFEVVADSGPVSGTSWQPARPLPRGVDLTWQVAAQLPGRQVIAPAPPEPEARFVVLDRATADALDAALAQLDDPLARGVLLARAGVLDEARTSLQLAAEGPVTAATARALLADLAEKQGHR